MSKFFHRCMGCWAGYCHCKGSRLPRKTKKQVKRFFLAVQYGYSRFDSEMCGITHTYKEIKKLMPQTAHFERYRKEYDGILALSKDAFPEGISLDENLRLSWYWEYDNGLYTQSGLMPFCYSEEEAGETWAYSEMNELIEQLTKGRIEKLPAEIKSDLDLITYIKNNPVPKEWLEYEEA